MLSTLMANGSPSVPSAGFFVLNFIRPAESVSHMGFNVSRCIHKTAPDWCVICTGRFVDSRLGCSRCGKVYRMRLHIPAQVADPDGRTIFTCACCTRHSEQIALQEAA